MHTLTDEENKRERAEE